MSSTMRGRSGPSRYGKRAASGPRDRRPPRMRRESSSTTRMDGNGDASPAFQGQADSLHVEDPPQWFLAYMENFKKQVIAELLNSLDTDHETEEKRRRYKKSYFMLKSRLHNLEKQMEEQNYTNKQQPQQPQFNGSSRAQEKPHPRKNSQTSHPQNTQNSSTSPSSPSPPSGGDSQPSQGTSKPREDRKSRRSQKKDKNSKNGDEKAETPDELQQETSEKSDEEKPQELSKKIRSILNKLTPSNFQNLLDQMKNLNVENENDEQEFIKQFFDKAIDEPMYSTTYALMCKQFVLLQPSILRLRRIIISRCESEFVKHVELDNLKVKKLEELAATTDDTEKEKLSEELKSMNEKNPKEFMGDILFISELYNQDLLCNKFLHKIIQHLLQSSNETNIEYLCKLLKNCGKNFELRGEDPALYYEKLIDMAEKDGLCTRIKFMIKDLIEMKLKSWETKRDNDDDVIESFSFSKSLDDCAYKDDDFMESFYKQIQPQFNFFESTNFTRELLNSAIERSTTRERYFDIFKRTEDNKIIEWVGGEEVFLGIVVRELGLFFDNADDVATDVPDVWGCLRDFLVRVVNDWAKELNGKKVLNILEAIKNVERRRKFTAELFDTLQVKMGEGRIKQWLPEGIPLVDDQVKN